MFHLQAEGPEKAQIGKMIQTSSTLSREAVMSFFSYFEPLLQDSKGSFAWIENFSGFQLAREEHNASVIYHENLDSNAQGTTIRRKDKNNFLK